jgi:hypothetical protein
MLSRFEISHKRKLCSSIGNVVNFQLVYARGAIDRAILSSSKIKEIVFLINVETEQIVFHSIPIYGLFMNCILINL